MNSNQLVDLFYKYGVASTDDTEREEILELIDDDEEPEINALEILAEIASEKSIYYSLGDCIDEEIIQEFKANFDEVLEICDGKIEISDFHISPEVGTEISISDKITVSFKWNDKPYEWCFSKVDNENFVKSFTQWLYEALDGDFLFIYEDQPFGYYIPNDLIKELESIGLKNQASPYTA